MLIIFSLIAIVLSVDWDKLMDRFEEEIKHSNKYATQILQEIQNSDRTNMTRQQTSRLNRQYGQYIFYGLDGQQDFAKALYFFKKSALQGNPKAQFYVSLMTYFRLDGSFHIEMSQTKDHLLDYGKNKYLSVSLIDQYFSASQEWEWANIQLGYRHLIGIGVEPNCSNAALYFLPVLDEYSKNPIRSKFIVENIKLSGLIYDSEFFMGSKKMNEHALIFENLKQITHDSIMEVKQLAHNYYYGLNGLRRNFTKAFELYKQLLKDVKDVESQVIVASMIIEGLVDNHDYKYAYQLLTSAEPKSNNIKGKLNNMLGYMYYYGIHVGTNQVKAAEYFKKAADLKNTDGMFNYGSILSLPSTLERTRNKKEGLAYIETAANSKHALAQYTLGLALLDGVDLFYSCELAAKLFHQAVLRGEWADNLKEANSLFLEEEFNMAFPRYIEAAFLGYKFGAENAGIIIDHFNGLIESTDYVNVEERIKNDPLYDGGPIFQFLFEDYLQLTTEPELKEILSVEQPKFKYWLSLQLYKQCAKEGESICNMKMADHLFYGFYKEKDEEVAYLLYKKALKGDMIDAMKAHCLFNLAYMKTFATGVKHDEELAVSYLNRSLTQFSLIPGVPSYVTLDLFKKAFRFYQISSDYEWYNVTSLINYDVINFDLKYTSSIMLAVVLLFTYGLKLRVENQYKL